MSPVVCSSLCVGALFFCSCASVSVKDLASTQGSQPTGRPEHVYVLPFSVKDTNVKEVFTRRNRGQLAGETQRILAAQMVKTLSRDIAPATLLPRESAAPASGWLVSGRITRVAEGNRLLRMGIGLGLGGTKLETAVEVRKLPINNRPFLHFATTGGSNAEPGAATNPIPFSAAPTALIQARAGVTDDAARTARMISATLAQYLAEHGWAGGRVVAKPKMFGQ